MWLLTERISNNASMASTVFSRCYEKDHRSTLHVVNIFLKNAKSNIQEKLTEIGFDNESRETRNFMLTIHDLVCEILSGRVNEEQFNRLVIKINHFRNIEHDMFGKQMHKHLCDAVDFDLKNWDAMSSTEQDYFMMIVKDMSSYKSENRINPALVEYYKETDPKFQELIVTD